jgi:hypothetical protein
VEERMTETEQAVLAIVCAVLGTIMVIAAALA